MKINTFFNQIRWRKGNWAEMIGAVCRFRVTSSHIHTCVYKPDSTRWHCLLLQPPPPNQPHSYCTSSHFKYFDFARVMLSSCLFTARYSTSGFCILPPMCSLCREGLVLLEDSLTAAGFKSMTSFCFKHFHWKKHRSNKAHQATLALCPEQLLR